MFEKTFQNYRYMILFAWMLASCTPKSVTPQSISDQLPTYQSGSNFNIDLFNFPQCLSLCWGGIEIDVTTFGEAKKILSERYGNNNIENVNNETIFWKANGTDGLSEGVAIFSKNVLADVSLTFDMNTNFTIHNLIEVFGEPTSVVIAGQPNNNCWKLDLLYKNKGVYASLEMNKEGKRIYPSQKVFMLRLLQTRVTENWNVNDGSLVKWDSYKDYCP
jgi:hypothetical protein